MNNLAFLIQIVLCDYSRVDRTMIPDFGGHYTDDAILYLKGVTAAATHDLLTYDCLLQSHPRHNLAMKWHRMMEFNFRINREWKDRTEKPNKMLKHCPVVNPNPELSDDIMHVIQIFHHEQMPPLQQLEIMASVFVKVMQLKFECYPTIGDRRLRKFGTMMNSILRTDRVSGTFCPNGGSH